MVQNLQNFAFWNLIIRPPRATYTKDSLGPLDFCFDGGQGRRRDVEIQTSRGSHLACSHFVPVNRGLSSVPVVIYLHGNTSNRLEAWDLVVPFLKQGVSLFCFDAAGCGISEGEYISLGFHERRDLADIVAHLRKSCFCGPIALWGWSMGAVTALLYADSDPLLAALCLESPFASLRRLVEDLAQQGTQINFTLPSWLIDPVISFIKMRVQDLAHFDIDELITTESAKKAKIPAIFISRRSDTFVAHHHTKDLLESYAGDHQHFLLEGDHSCTRTAEDITRIVEFFCGKFLSHASPAVLQTPSLFKLDGMLEDAEQDADWMLEEHESNHPVPRNNPIPRNSRRPGLQKDLWPEMRTVAGEGERSKPRFSTSSGIDFPEPKPIVKERAPQPIAAEPVLPSRATKPQPPAEDWPQLFIPAEPMRSLPCFEHIGCGVTAKPRQD